MPTIHYCVLKIAVMPQIAAVQMDQGTIQRMMNGNCSSVTTVVKMPFTWDAIRVTLEPIHVNIAMRKLFH